MFLLSQLLIHLKQAMNSNNNKKNLTGVGGGIHGLILETLVYVTVFAIGHDFPCLK